MAQSSDTQVVLGIDPGLANTGWGVIARDGARFSCIAYGCVSTPSSQELSVRLKTIHDRVCSVVERYHPEAVGIETVWFGDNVTSAFATGQARGAALVATASYGLEVGEFAPSTIKQTVVGTGDASKKQVQYMMKQMFGLEQEPQPDHAADALAAAVCYALHKPTPALDSALRMAGKR